MTNERLLVTAFFLLMLLVGAWITATANGRRAVAAVNPDYDQGLSGPLFLLGVVLAVPGAIGFVVMVVA